jgi:hypothetical protein
MAWVFVLAGVYALLVIAMSYAQKRYLRHYREHHNVDLPLPEELTTLSLVREPGRTYHLQRRIRGLYFEPQADRELERLRRRVLLYLGLQVLFMLALFVVPALYVVGKGIIGGR